MMIPDGVHGRPGDQRGFLHKSFLGRAIGGVAKRLVPGVAIASDVLQGVKSLVSRPTVSRVQTARITVFSQREKDVGRILKFPELSSGFRPDPGEIIQQGINIGRRIISGDGNGNGMGPCEDPRLIRSPQGNCIFPGSPRGAALFGGEAILGQYGAGIVAGSRIIDRATCPRTMQLGNDGVCYNKSQISNKQRMWPAGRKPLLTGGDMRSISTAARAGKRMDLATKRLQKMGMMKKPTSRRAISPREVTQIRHAAVLEAHAAGRN